MDQTGSTSHNYYCGHKNWRLAAAMDFSRPALSAPEQTASAGSGCERKWIHAFGLMGFAGPNQQEMTASLDHSLQRPAQTIGQGQYADGPDLGFKTDELE